MASRSWNRVELIGNLTRDPELRYTPNGAAVVSFSVATNRSFISDGERKEEADFHRCIAWNKLAELCSQLLKKGNRVFVSGRLQNRSWEGQDGTQRQTTEIVIEDMILLTSKNETVESFGEDATPPPPPSASSSQNQDRKTKVADKNKENKEKDLPDRASEEATSASSEEVSDEDLPF